MKQWIAIDIGGTEIKYGTVSEEGKVLQHFSAPTPSEASGEELLELLGGIIAPLIGEETAGIGIATLGAVNVEKGCVIGMCENLPALKDLPLKQALSGKFGLPVSVMNDVNAAALGEAAFGAGRGIPTFFCMALGTGIGGAFVYEGRIVNGVHGTTGEIGYLWSGQSEMYESWYIALFLLAKEAARFTDAVCSGAGIRRCASRRFRATRSIRNCWKSG